MKGSCGIDKVKYGLILELYAHCWISAYCRIRNNL